MPPLDAEKNIVVQLFKLLSAEEGARQEDLLRAGGYGYGSLKKAFFEYYWNYFAPYRARRVELAADPATVQKILTDGADRARTIAQATLKKAKLACGLD